MARSFCAFLLVAALSGCLALQDANAQQQRSVDLPWDHPEMQAAIAKARRSLPVFWQKFDRPSPSEINFSLQVEFSDGDKVEHLWVLMIERTGDDILGTIATEPQTLTNIKYGDRVRFSEAQISDWSYGDKGRVFGYETIRPLMKRMPDDQARAWEHLFSGRRD